MKLLQYFVLSLSLAVIISTSVYAQPTGRTFGARRLTLDAGDGILSNNVFFIDRTGSLGIDNVGLVTLSFPNTCALLDISSTTKGVLLPRMTKAQELAICGGLPPEGLMVYNTTTHSQDFFNGTGYTSPWVTKGNYGTDPTSDFIGTFDATDLVFRTTSIERARIFSTGNVSIGTPAAASHLQINEVGAQEAFNANTTGSGRAGSFAILNAGNNSTALNVSSTGTGTGLSITTPNSNNLLVVNGAANATVLNLAADPVWDSRIIGDQLVTGVQKVGGSIWLDGNSATHQIVTNANVNIGTRTNNTVAIVSNNAARLSIDGLGAATMTGTAFAATYPTGINFTSAGSGNGNFIASFTNPNNSNGISIQLGSGTPANANNYVEFRNSGGTVVGRIEGETLSELHATPEWIEAIRVFDANIIIGSLQTAVAAASVAVGVADAVDAADPLCDVACPGSVAAGFIEIVLGAAETALNVAQVAEFAVEKTNYQNNLNSQIGVTYQSGAGDYAEWLPKMDMSEKFSAGNIVGVKGGVITKNTDGATQLMVISRKPIVLGNTPEEGKEANYEKVAFMGQVPVVVLGKVNRGDYILPSGGHNGMGIAISPEKMTTSDYKKVVGVAWSASQNDAVNEINVAVGINSLAVGTEMERQAAEIRSLKASINHTNEILSKLVPGFKEASEGSMTEVAAPPANGMMIALKGKEVTTSSPVKTGNALYFTKELVEKEFANARKTLTEKGYDFTSNPFFTQFDSNSAFKESAINMIKDKLNQAFIKQAELKAAKNNTPSQN